MNLSPADRYTDISSNPWFSLDANEELQYPAEDPGHSSSSVEDSVYQFLSQCLDFRHPEEHNIPDVNDDSTLLSELPMLSPSAVFCSPFVEELSRPLALSPMTPSSPQTTMSQNTGSPSPSASLFSSSQRSHCFMLTSSDSTSPMRSSSSFNRSPMKSSTKSSDYALSDSLLSPFSFPTHSFTEPLFASESPSPLARQLHRKTPFSPHVHDTLSPVVRKRNADALTSSPHTPAKTRSVSMRMLSASPLTPLSSSSSPSSQDQNDDEAEKLKFFDRHGRRIASRKKRKSNDGGSSSSFASAATWRMMTTRLRTRSEQSPTPMNRFALPAGKRTTRITDSQRSLPTVSPSLPSSRASSVNEAPVVPVFSQRSFPDQTRLQKSDHYPLFYRKFPASSYYMTEDETPLLPFESPGGMYNMPRSKWDLYTPRFVKGKGTEKMGLCPICIEPSERGGEGKKKWLAMKFSAYKYTRLFYSLFVTFADTVPLSYHMQYSHGISAATGKPFSPPIAFRTTTRPNPGKNERTEIREAKCHKCKLWVAAEGIKDIDVKVRELHWWKHAAGCHAGSILEGEGDIFEDDNVLEKLVSLEG